MKTLPEIFNRNRQENTTLLLYAYINNKKHKIGYAYTTKNGNLCIKADKMMDKTQLGRLLVKGVYLNTTKQ